MLYVHEVRLLILLFSVELYHKMFVNAKWTSCTTHGAKTPLHRVESP